MENNERDRKLDQWLNEALSQYGAAEPRLGLEQRILAHVRAEEQARAGRRTWWRWMPAFAAIAAVLVVMVAIKPYWEEKTSRKVFDESPAGVEKKQAQGTKSDAMSAALQAPSQGQPESRSSTSTKKLSAANASENLPAKQKAIVPIPEKSSQRAKVEEDASVAKDLRQALKAKQEELSKQTDSRQDMRLAQSGAVAGVSGGATPSAKVVAVPRPATVPVQGYVPQMQTVQVQNAAAPAPMQHGEVAADRLPAPTEGSVQVRTVQAKPAADAMANTMEVMGVTLRADAIMTQGRRVQQFPTPMPLSKEERLMLAASKQLQEKPAASDHKKKDEISPIEIKKLEIEPLPGPEK